MALPPFSGIFRSSFAGKASPIGPFLQRQAKMVANSQQNGPASQNRNQCPRVQTGLGLTAQFDDRPGRFRMSELPTGYTSPLPISSTTEKDSSSKNPGRSIACRLFTYNLASAHPPFTASYTYACYHIRKSNCSVSLLNYASIISQQNIIDFRHRYQIYMLVATSDARHRLPTIY